MWTSICRIRNILIKFGQFIINVLVMWFVAKGVPAVMVVMFHNLNPGHFFSSCTHTGVHIACDWLQLSKPFPVIG